MHVISIISQFNIENLAIVKASTQNYLGWEKLLVTKRCADRIRIQVQVALLNHIEVRCPPLWQSLQPPKVAVHAQVGWSVVGSARRYAKRPFAQTLVISRD